MRVDTAPVAPARGLTRLQGAPNGAQNLQYRKLSGHNRTKAGADGKPPCCVRGSKTAELERQEPNKPKKIERHVYKSTWEPQQPGQDHPIRRKGSERRLSASTCIYMVYHRLLQNAKPFYAAPGRPLHQSKTPTKLAAANSVGARVVNMAPCARR